jgi:hypothetical protein
LRDQAKVTKTPITLTYTAKLLDIDFLDISEKCDQQKNNPNNNEKMKKGYNEFQNCLIKYFDMSNISAEGSVIKIFSSVTLKNGAILRATNKFHNRPWFGNIAIAMNNDELFEYQSDSGICYAQVLFYNNYNLKIQILTILIIFRLF